jgi:hypothetical protein
MIKTTLGQLVSLAQSKALGKFFSLGKPVAKYWCNRMLPSQCESELKAWNAARVALIDRYNVKIEDGGKLAFPEGKQDPFNAEVDELLGKPVVFDDAIPVLATDLDGSLLESEMVALEAFIASPG